MRYTKVVPVIAYLLLLTGCSTQSYAEWDQNRRNAEIDRLSAQANQPASERDYNEGTQHGYESGLNTTGDWTRKFQKNIDKYVDNKYYKAGWDDGFAKGKGLGDSVNNSIDAAQRRY
jgi:hypothetical protein